MHGHVTSIYTFIGTITSDKNVYCNEVYLSVLLQMAWNHSEMAPCLYATIEIGTCTCSLCRHGLLFHNHRDCYDSRSMYKKCVLVDK